MILLNLREANDNGLIAFRKAYGDAFSWENIAKFCRFALTDPTTVVAGKIKAKYRSRGEFRRRPEKAFGKKTEEDKIRVLETDIKKTGKYTAWIIKVCTKFKTRIVDLDKVEEMLTAFDRNKSKITNKNILSYKTLTDLEKAVKAFMKGGRVVVQRYKKRPDALYFELVEGWELWVPFTWEAMRYYGKGSEWCVVGQHNYWNQYIQKDPLCVVINTAHKTEKYLFHGEDMDEFNNKENHNSKREFQQEVPEVYKSIEKLIAKSWRNIMKEWEDKREGIDLEEHGFTRHGSDYALELDVIEDYLQATNRSAYDVVAGLEDGSGYETIQNLVGGIDVDPHAEIPYINSSNIERIKNYIRKNTEIAEEELKVSNDDFLETLAEAYENDSYEWKTKPDHSKNMHFDFYGEYVYKGVDLDELWEYIRYAIGDTAIRINEERVYGYIKDKISDVIYGYWNYGDQYAEFIFTEEEAMDWVDEDSNGEFYSNHRNEIDLDNADLIYGSIAYEDEDMFNDVLGDNLYSYK